MAIVEMKRIDLLAMRQDQRKLLRTLQDMGCVEITPLQDAVSYTHLTLPTNSLV